MLLLSGYIQYPSRAKRNPTKSGKQLHIFQRLCFYD